jgi:hypothetical protein
MHDAGVREHPTSLADHPVRGHGSACSVHTDQYPQEQSSRGLYAGTEGIDLALRRTHTIMAIVIRIRYQRYSQRQKQMIRGVTLATSLTSYAIEMMQPLERPSINLAHLKIVSTTMYLRQ